MNIFFLDLDPTTAAKYHCNKHVVKMILETAQILCTVHHIRCDNGDHIPYKATHRNHPSVLWANECYANYSWLCDLGSALCDEFEDWRDKQHKTSEVIDWANTQIPKGMDRGVTAITPPKLAMPDDCIIDNPTLVDIMGYKPSNKNNDQDIYGFTVASYRNYYLKEKKDMATWDNRQIPEWFTSN